MSTTRKKMFLNKTKLHHILLSYLSLILRVFYPIFIYLFLFFVDYCWNKWMICFFILTHKGCCLCCTNILYCPGNTYKHGNKGEKIGLQGFKHVLRMTLLWRNSVLGMCSHQGRSQRASPKLGQVRVRVHTTVGL